MEASCYFPLDIFFYILNFILDKYTVSILKLVETTISIVNFVRCYNFTHTFYKWTLL